MLPTWHKIGKPSPLFTKIEDQKIEMLRKKYDGQQETNNGISANKASDESITLEAAITKQVSKSFLSAKKKSISLHLSYFLG